MKKILFCRECGLPLQKTSISAYKIKIWYPDGMGGSMFRLDSRFDEETGQENIAEQLVCPMWKKWFNNHDKIIKYKNEYHWI